MIAVPVDKSLSTNLS